MLTSSDDEVQGIGLLDIALEILQLHQTFIQLAVQEHQIVIVIKLPQKLCQEKLGERHFDQYPFIHGLT